MGKLESRLENNRERNAVNLRSIFERICLPVLDETIDKEQWKIRSEFNYGPLTMNINAVFYAKSESLSLLITFPHGVPDDQLPCLLDLLEKFNPQMGELSSVTLDPSKQRVFLGEVVYANSYFLKVQLEPFMHRLFSKAYAVYRLVERVIKRNEAIEEAMEGIWYQS